MRVVATAVDPLLLTQGGLLAAQHERGSGTGSNGAPSDAGGAPNAANLVAGRVAGFLDDGAFTRVVGLLNAALPDPPGNELLRPPQA